MDKLPIWGNVIPYNEPGKSKKYVMTIRKMPKPLAMIVWLKDVFGSKIAKDSGSLDTFTYLDEIAPGKVSTRFDDVPNLIPFVVEGADTAVIVAPGGGFCNQARDYEGTDIAAFLNQQGISAFVLEYRMNPYEAPVCYLDMQRAIRFVRFHAAEYGIDPQKIGAMGFSAGGFITGASAIFLKDEPVVFEGYKPDAVDQVDGLANFLGMIYPLVRFEGNPNMLGMMDRSFFTDPDRKEELMKRYSLIENVQADLPPVFLCYGTKDPLKGMKEFNDKLEELNIPHEHYVLEGASHGFGLRQKKYAHWGDAFVAWIKKTVNEES